jgi:hypothetical protein
LIAYSVRSGETADFDAIVNGGGTGNTVARAAAGLETALVEPGPLGDEGS